MDPLVPRYSLGFLFRTTTCVALVLAWGGAIASLSPFEICFGMASLGVVLGVIVGWRRLGTRLAKVIAAVGFALGSSIVAGYSGFVALWYQSSPRGILAKLQSQDLETGIGTFLLLIPTPVVFLVLLYLLRAWTWSAHDVQMRRERMLAGGSLEAQ